jgi:hypothetical protein
MFKTTVKYTDFNGNEKEEILRFDLSEEELMDLMRLDEDFTAGHLTAIMETKNMLAMFNVIRKLIIVSYGEISEDGKYFRKSEKITEDFTQSAMYRAFRERLFNSEDTKEVEKFILNVVPAKLAKEIGSHLNENAAGLTVVQ